MRFGQLARDDVPGAILVALAAQDEHGHLPMDLAQMLLMMQLDSRELARSLEAMVREGRIKPDPRLTERPDA